MNLFHICAAAGAAAWRFTCMSLVGGPVGVYHTVKLARIRARMKDVADCIDREKDLHRDNLRALNHELTQLVMEQQSVSHAAAQFWNNCKNRAGL